MSLSFLPQIEGQWKDNQNVYSFTRKWKLSMEDLSRINEAELMIKLVVIHSAFGPCGFIVFCKRHSPTSTITQ
jgi:hypothetical protein